MELCSFTWTLGNVFGCAKQQLRVSVRDHYSSSQHNGPFGNYTNCGFGLFLNDWECVCASSGPGTGRAFLCRRAVAGKQRWGWRSLAVGFEALWSVGQPLLLLQAALAFFYLEEFNSTW